MTDSVEKIKKEIVIYQAPSGAIEFRKDIPHDTVWATQAQITKLFDVERSVTTKHIRNVFRDGELDKNSVCAKFAHTAADGKKYMVGFYNLDVILSVGYRTNSKRAINFRKWATKTLREHIIKGYTINEKRLLQAEDKFKELQTTIGFLREKAKHELLIGQEQEILNLLASYSKTLTLLEQYDKEKVILVKNGRGKFVLAYNDAVEIIQQVKSELIAKREAADIFGNEYEGKLQAI